MPTPIQQSTLSGGELAPSLYGRVDIERYRQSAALVENFVVDPHGGVRNRQGSEKFGECKFDDGSTFRLITFAPSAEESYVLEFGHQYLRIHDKDGLLYSGGYAALQVNDKVPFDGYAGNTSFVYDDFHGQEFIGDAVSPFEIGKIGFKLVRSFGTKFSNAKVAIFTNVAGLPGVEVPGLGFNDFQSMEDVDLATVPHIGTGVDGGWVYFKLKDPTAGAAPFAPGTILHAVIRLDHFVDAEQLYYRVTNSQGDLFPGGRYSRKADTIAAVWTLQAAGLDLCFGVFNNDQPAVVELVTPWTATTQDDEGTESQISRLTVTQSVDVMTIVDGTKINHAYELKRASGDAWTLDTIQKFTSVGEPDAVLFPAIGQPTLAPTRTWQYAVAGVTVDGKESLPKLSAEREVGANVSTVIPQLIEITCGDIVVDHYAVYKGLDGTFGFIGTARWPRTVTELADAAYWRAYHLAFHEYVVSLGRRLQDSDLTAAYAYATAAGVAARDAAAIAGGVTPNVDILRFEDENIAPDYTDPPRNGANEFTEDGRYKPACVAYYQQRLVFANVLDRVDTIFMSEVSDYQSFQRSIPTVDDDAIEATLAQTQLNEIRFLVPMRDLLVLTTGAEHVLSGGGKPVTPSNLDAAPVSHRGSGTLHPLVVGNVILFKDIGGHVREWLYEHNSNDYPAADVGLLANHLFRDEATGKPVKITEWAYVSSPSSVITAIRADGLMLTFTYVRDQNVAAWTRHVTDGKYRSVCSARNLDAEGETIYTVVEREVAGARTWFIEKSATRDFTSPFSDCAVIVELDSQTRNGEAVGEDNWEFMLGTGSGWSIDTLAELVSGATCEIRIPKFILPGSLLGTPVYPDFAGDEKRWIVLYDADGNRYTMQILSVWPGIGNEDTYQVVLNMDIPAALAVAPDGSRWELGAKRFVGYDHLIGETVAVRGDSGAHAPLVVEADGSITLNLIVNTCAAGLPFESTVRTLPLAGGRGDIKSKQKLISICGIDIAESAGIWAGESLDSMTQQRAAFDDPTAPQTGRVDVRYQNTWNTGGQIYIQNRDPIACTILGFSPEVSVGG